MPELKLYTSNRMEILADGLAYALRKPLLSPMTREVIVVQSNGMKRWISLQLADRFGVWANCRYSFPNNIIQEIFNAVIGDVPEGRFFEIDIATWQIMKLLPLCIAKTDSEHLKNYLAGEKNFLKTYQLSAQIANIFDQYLTFRPEMILEWEKGEDDDWQAELWRLLRKELPAGHPPALRDIFFQRITDPSIIRNTILPERIAVFGISTLPQFHMDVLTAMSEHLDVNIFLLNPSEKYWADVRSEHEIAIKLKKETDIISSAEDLHLEKGNSLLASMGKLGRDFLWIIMNYDIQSSPLFENPGYECLLYSIQADILNMIDRGASTEEDAKKIQLSPEKIKLDTSITINSCHSPTREVEVLYDFLLDLFNIESGLEPRDILVMTPDIETYAPFIQAIFGAPEDEARRIPFSIADRSIRRESRSVDTFFDVLELTESRFTAGSVLDVLECGDVLRRFNLIYADIELIRKWVRDTRICWGIDASARGKIGLPEFNENTWSAGIDRLLLGYALSGKDESMFCDILPYDKIEGNESMALGKFIEFFNMLSTNVNNLAENKTLCNWSETLSNLLDSLFLPDEDTEYEAQLIRNAFGKFTLIEEQSDFHEEIEFAVVKSLLEHALVEESISSGFLTGRVTFCTMLPMRSIPFKIVCLIGMNDAAFPRATRTPGFDIIAKNPRRGDRSQRNDDRYIFLESIISAREKLYISYTGQSIQDNIEIPPSVVVSELMDYIDQGFEIPGENILSYIVTRHPLQAFSSRYFSNEGKLFSYSEENCGASRAMLSERKNSAPFIAGKLTETTEDSKVINIKDLLKFFDNPARHILTKKLGLYLDEASTAIDEREPFDIDGLDKYQLEQSLCERYLRSQDVEPLYRISRSEGLLPHGDIGDFAFKSLIPGVQNFVRNIKSYMNGEKLDPYEIDLDFDEYKLTGQIADIWPDGLLRFRYAKAKAKDRFRAWLMHLISNSVKLEQSTGKSFLVCKDSIYIMEPLENSFDILRKLIKIYRNGQEEALRFFPETSLEYAEKIILKKKSHNEALRTAISKWESSDFNRGERADPYYDLCFGQIDPFNKSFTELSMEVFEPLLSCQKKARR